MVIADPSSELLDLVRHLGDPAPPTAPEAERAAAALIRRRFGLSLPPPFAGRPGADEPVRVAAATDGAAIAAVKWRAFGASYRGILPDAFLDGRDVVPPASYWTGRALLPPSRRHHLLVWGRPGTVLGYADCGPADPASGEVGEVFELYVDPTAQGAGGGSRLLLAAEERLWGSGFARLELSVLAANDRAQAFYRARGWEPTGRTEDVDLGVVRFTEVRFARRGGGGRT